ncbi:MAG TPA: hypothetical protein VFX49_04020 [Chloroflexota bacterium]|nr:hypothetical protein [Chloroflexota bacterium]
MTQADPAQPATPAAPKTETILKANVSAPLEHEIAAVEAEKHWSGPAFWGRWVGVTTLGWGAGGAALGFAAGLTGNPDSVAVQAAGLLVSFVVLVLQWAVLRGRLPRAWRWIVVGIAGEAIGFALFLAVQLGLRGIFGGPSITENVASLFVPSIPATIAQWLLLRTYARRAWRWLLANLLYLVLFTPLFLLGVAEEFEPSMGEAITRAIGLGIQNAVLGFVASAIVGAEMVWLLKHPRAEAAETSTIA